MERGGERKRREGRNLLEVTGLIQIQEEEEQKERRKKKKNPNRGRYYLHTAAIVPIERVRFPVETFLSLPFPFVRRKDLVARREHSFELLLRAHLQPLPPSPSPSPSPSPLVTASKEQNGSSVFYKKEAARASTRGGGLREWLPRCRGAGVPVSVDVKRSFLKGTVMQLSTCIAEAFSFLCRLFASVAERPCHGS